jgi:hypothetical protein
MSEGKCIEGLVPATDRLTTFSAVVTADFIVVESVSESGIEYEDSHPRTSQSAVPQLRRSMSLHNL